MGGNMRRGVLFVGWFLIIIGLVALLDTFLKVNVWNYFWPVVLVALGIWILVKPANSAWWNWFGVFGAHGEEFSTIFTGTGKVREQSIFAGETTIDLGRMEIPDGGLNLKFNGFAGEVRLLVPTDVGVRVKANYFAGELQIFGEKMSGVMAPVEGETPGFDMAAKKVYAEIHYFAGETQVIRAA